MSLRSVRKCSGCLHLHYLSSNFLQILWGNKEARQTTVDHSASSWYSPDPLHEPTSEHNERTPLSPFPLKSSGSQGRQNSSEDGGYLRSIPSETAARRKQPEHLGSLTLEGAVCPGSSGAGCPLWGSSIQSGSGLQSRRSLRIHWNRTRHNFKKATNAAYILFYSQTA